MFRLSSISVTLEQNRFIILKSIEKSSQKIDFINNLTDINTYSKFEIYKELWFSYKYWKAFSVKKYFNNVKIQYIIAFSSFPIPNLFWRKKYITCNTLCICILNVSILIIRCKTWNFVLGQGRCNYFHLSFV